MNGDCGDFLHALPLYQTTAVSSFSLLKIQPNLCYFARGVKNEEISGSEGADDFVLGTDESVTFATWRLCCVFM